MVTLQRLDEGKPINSHHQFNKSLWLNKLDKLSVRRTEDRKQAKCQELDRKVMKTVTLNIKIDFWIINNSLHDHELMFGSW